MATPKQLIKRGTGKTAAITVTAEGLRVITELATAGQDLRTIANRLGIGHTTLRDLAKKHDAVQEALDVGHAALSDELTHHLLTAARKGQWAAAIYLTKARCGWRENDAPDTRPNITINLPDSKTPDDYLAAIAQANAKALPPIAPKGIKLEPPPTAEPDGSITYTSEQ